MTPIFIPLLAYTFGIVLVIFVIMQRKDPVATLAWIFVIITLPVAGVIFYLWFGYGRIKQRVRRRQQSNVELERKVEYSATAARGKAALLGTFNCPVQRFLTKITEEIGAFTVTSGNSLRLLTNPDEVFPALEHAIKNAKHSIHMEYYIFRRDGTGRQIRDLLVAAAQRGVEVRLLVDGVGSWTIGDMFAMPLKRAGAKFARYLPVTFLGRPWHWNMRNHRKITVIDGTLGMIGSMNIGDEYRLRTGGSHDFYDAQITCEGPVVRQLQEIFASDWFFATKENLLDSRQYFPIPASNAQSCAQIVESGPDEEKHALYEMICAAVHAAEKSVRITSPYFIPDQALIIALRTAALKGVKVAIMLARHFPSLHEKLISFATHSYYEDLLDYGIDIYEYMRGFMHAKSISVDGAWASMGTANMDIRSFRLNFEVNSNFYSRETVALVDGHFEENLQYCEKIELEKFRKRPFAVRGIENTMRLFSPIL